MGVLDRFEKGIERAVNGAFAKAFRSEVQPVEIASALRRECDEKASVVARDRTIAPNAFVVELGRADHERLGEWETALGDELSAAVHEHARQQRYAFLGPVQVSFAEAEDLDTGVFRVRSQNARPESMQPAQGYPQGQPQGYPQDRPQQYPAQDPYAQQGRPQDQYGRPADPYAAQQDPYARPGDPQRAPQAPQGQPHGGLPAAPPFPGAPPAGYPMAGAPAPSGHPAPQAHQAPQEQQPAYDPQPQYQQPAYQQPAYQQPGYQQPAYQQPAPQQPAQPQYAPDQGGYAPSWTTPQTSLGSLDVDGRPQKIERAVTVIGRAMDVDVVLDDPGVSRRHAEVHVVDGKARVIDLGSTNGTFVDGERVHAGALADGSTITVGRTRITYHSGQW